MQYSLKYENSKAVVKFIHMKRGSNFQSFDFQRIRRLSISGISRILDTVFSQTKTHKVKKNTPFDSLH